MEIFFLAALLGVVEGLTEFLPVSSTGHLILLGNLLGFQGPPGKTFEIIIQLGAILAVVVTYWNRLWGAVIHAPHDPKSRAFIINIILGFLPAMIIGALAYSLIRQVLDMALVIPIALIIGGIIILILERIQHKPKFQTIEEFPATLSLKIGLCQCIAMIPGVSRSGATIMGSLLMGVERKAATEYSFFLAIPTMLGATVFKLYKDWELINFDNGLLILIGFLMAFVSALMVIRWAVAFISKHGFTPFAWYRIVFGCIMMGYLLITP